MVPTRCTSWLCTLSFPSQALGAPDDLCKALRKLRELSPGDQAAVAVALKKWAYTDPTIAEGVWKVISDASWRHEVFANVDTLLLGLLVEAFSNLQVNNREKWFSSLPQYIAELCEKSNDEERRRHLFLRPSNQPCVRDHQCNTTASPR